MIEDASQANEGQVKADATLLGAKQTAQNRNLQSITDPRIKSRKVIDTWTTNQLDSPPRSPKTFKSQ
jgi:hypothetical protein